MSKFDFSVKVREEIIERDGGRCRAYWIAEDIPCSSILEIDHIIPRSREGCTNDVSNGWLLCKHCHTLKHSYVLAAEYLGLYGQEIFEKKFDPHMPETFGRAITRMREQKKKMAGV